MCITIIANENKTSKELFLKTFIIPLVGLTQVTIQNRMCKGDIDSSEDVSTDRIYWK